jgi:DNA invertase Pin-like site-specific DNA recombinase
MTVAVPPGSHGKIYVRVSTMHQAGDELPIESQISELQAAVDAAGATAEVVIDAGISGTDLEGRAGLQSIMAAAREDRPGFSWVLAWKYSRFARNMEEALIYRALLKKRGIDLISYKEPVPDGHLGALITHILMAIDEFYAAATAADVLRSQKELTRQGFSAGGRPPVGLRRSVEVIGTKYGGAPLTRVRWVPDPDTAPRVVQAFQMAADGATYEAILAATGICSNKSSLATILANTSYRGLRVFNRESRIEGEHGRKRRKNNAEDMVTSEVEAIVPDALFDRVQVRLRTNRDNRLPPQRYAGGYVLTDVLRCQCGGKMAGNIAGSSRIRYYRCTAKCGRSSVPADELEQSVMDLVRRDLLSEEAVQSVIDSINEAIASRDVGRGPALAAGKAEIKRLEREEANLHAALRQASAATMPSVLSALEDIATELSAAHARLDAIPVREKPVNVSDESVAATLAQLRGIAENGSLVDRVAWIRSAFDHVEVFDDHAEAHWRETEEPVTSSIDVSSWLRR